MVTLPSSPPDLVGGDEGNDGGGDGPPLHSLPSLRSCQRGGVQQWQRRRRGGYRVTNLCPLPPSLISDYLAQGEVDDGEKTRFGGGDDDDRA